LTLIRPDSSPQAARCIPQARLAPEEIFGFDIGEEDPATAGRYRLVTDEDEMLGLSFLAFPRTATMLHIPAISISDHPNQVFHVNSAELAAALMPFGGFLVTQQAAKRMVPRGRGAILLTGATASVKGFALSSAFAMGKFALRGLAQSAARELGSKGIHVAHLVIDGGVRSARHSDPADRPDSTLDPDAIAETYIDVLRQHRSAWSLEVEVRPWVEDF
jgi:NAD(P)-dependent dehydrogenase (short-subunit alcohol dehydrogenase family)